MKFNKWTIGLVAAISLMVCAASASAQSIASGVPGGTSGIPNEPAVLAANTQTNLPLAQGTSIDLRVNRNLAVEQSFNGLTSAATNANVVTTFAFSMDGTTFDPTNTFTLTTLGIGTATARSSKTVDTGAFPFVIPVSTTNGVAVTISNLVVRYATKNGS